MKLHVSAYRGHHQVSIPMKGGSIYLSGGGVDVEISMHQFPVAPILISYTTGMTHLKIHCTVYYALIFEVPS